MRDPKTSLAMCPRCRVKYALPSGYCRDCRNAYMRERYQRQKELLAEVERGEALSRIVLPDDGVPVGPTIDDLVPWLPDESVKDHNLRIHEYYLNNPPTD